MEVIVGAVVVLFMTVLAAGVRPLASLYTVVGCVYCDTLCRFRNSPQFRKLNVKRSRPGRLGFSFLAHRISAGFPLSPTGSSSRGLPGVGPSLMSRKKKKKFVLAGDGDWVMSGVSHGC